MPRGKRNVSSSKDEESRRQEKEAPKKPKMENPVPSSKLEETKIEVLDGRISRHEFFMGVAELLRMKSHDPNTKVGCSFMQSDNRTLVGIGYNGLFRGLENYPENLKGDEKDNYMQHAEMNAIHFSVTKEFGEVTAYVTCFPCKDCANSLIQKRIEAVVYNIGIDKYTLPSHLLFRAAGVTYTSLSEVMKRNKKCFIAFQDAYKDQKECIESIQTESKKDDLFEKSDLEDSKTGRPLDWVPKQKILSWDHLYMNIAVLAERRSVGNAPSGCCIARNTQCLGYGYSGYSQSFLNQKTEFKITLENIVRESPEIKIEGQNVGDKAFDTATQAVFDKAVQAADRDAIRNALSFLGNVEGAIVYSSQFPTDSAMRELIQRKVSLVYYLNKPSPKQKAPREGFKLPESKAVKKLASLSNVALRRWKPTEKEPIYRELVYMPVEETTLPYGFRPGEQALCHLNESFEANAFKAWETQTPDSFSSVKKRHMSPKKSEVSPIKTPQSAPETTPVTGKSKPGASSK